MLRYEVNACESESTVEVHQQWHAQESRYRLGFSLEKP